MGITAYSTTPNSNAAINGINIGEGCLPGNLNDAIRQLMADVKTDLGNAAGIPALVATDYLRANAAGNGWEFRTPAQVQADLGLVIGTNVQAFDAATAKTNVAQTWTLPQRGAVITLTDGATITPDFGAGQLFTVTLGGNRTLANPTNLVAGQTGSIRVVQDGTGGRSLAFGSAWKFPSGIVPTFSASAGAKDRIDYIVWSATEIEAVVSLDNK